LLEDIGILITASSVCGAIASALGQPILLGYLIGGSVIGPGCLGLIQQFVQVETLAQLGATFLLFGLGCEFSVSNLVRVRRVAILGGILQILVVIGISCLAGTSIAGMSVSSSCFLGCVLAMSSTTMVVKGLMETNEINTAAGKITVGILVMQDICLAIMLAVMPVVSAGGSIERMFMIVLIKLLVMACIILVCRWIWPVCLRALQGSKSQDLFLLGVVTLCVVMTMMTEKVLNSAEVGAFLSGMLINTAPRDLSSKAVHLFEPVRDIFAALFFSSIGMLINPAFLVKQAIAVSILVVGVLIGKVLILTPLVIGLGSDVPGVNLEMAIRSSISLANIGEFAFVLANGGLEMGFLDSEWYKVLLGAAALSLLISPLATNALHHLTKMIILNGVILTPSMEADVAKLQDEKSSTGNSEILLTNVKHHA